MRVVKGLLERCVGTVELLAAAPDGARLSDIARRLHMPKAAAHRLLTELVRLGWVDQHGANGAYALAARLPLITQRALRATGLPGLAQPVLDRVAQETRELARIAIALPDRLVWLAQAQGAPPGLLYQPAMADAVLPHATANGKAWLATLPDSVAIAIARAAGLGARQPTARTLATQAALRDALAAVRRRGFAVAEEEAEPGVVAVAVAIGGPPALATLSVAGPVVRLPASRRPALAALLAGAARDLAAIWPKARQEEATR